MRVAFVMVRAPFPLDTGGKIRSFHLLKEISRLHEVTLVSGIANEQERLAAASLREEVPDLTLRPISVAARNGVTRRLWRAGTNVFDSLPYTWAAYRDARFTANLRGVLASVPYDVVHCDHVQVAHAVASLRTPPRVLNAHNVDSVLLRRLAAVEPNRIRRRLIEWQAGKVRRAEQRAYREFDACVAMSDVDRAHILTIAPAVWVAVVPNGVDLSWFRPSGTPPEPDLMVFSGSMDWEPNIDAAVYFARNVLPRVRRSRPMARFLVAGRDPSPELRAQLRGEPGVAFSGTVPDIRPYLTKACLVVVPLRVGSGTRLKILEAWAMAKPVLSTTVGAEGLPARDGENIAIADSAEDMAARAVDLLTRAKERERLGMMGQQMAEDRFSWSTIGRSLATMYDTVVKRQGSTGSRVR